MELRDALARRRMVRSFDGSSVDPSGLEELCAEALRAPTAGNSAGVRMCVVESHHVSGFLDVATDPAWRASSSRFAGLARAGAVVLVTSRPRDYFERYGEPDKADTGLVDRAAWPLAYWHVDAAMATMALLLLLEEAGLAATIWGAFRHASAILDWAGLRDEELVASVLVGRADGNDRRSSSLERAVPTRTERVRRL